LQAFKALLALERAGAAERQDDANPHWRLVLPLRRHGQAAGRRKQCRQKQSSIPELVDHRSSLALSPMLGIELDRPSTGCTGPPLCPVRATPIAIEGSWAPHPL